MKYLSNVFWFAAAISLMACVTQSEPLTDHNSMNSLDWPGIYRGVLPCADCEGIDTEIKLDKDLTYSLKIRYLGKGDSVFENRGTFAWHDQGNQIILDSASQGSPIYFLVGENRITQLDLNGHPITGRLADRYILKKQGMAITETYWQLTELFGKPVALSERGRKQVHMILKTENNQVFGSGGCNNFHGGYELKPGNRIAFTKLASTMMACPDMETESQFFKVLEMADNYHLGDGVLILHKARMAPLARFEAVLSK